MANVVLLPASKLLVCWIMVSPVFQHMGHAVNFMFDGGFTLRMEFRFLTSTLVPSFVSRPLGEQKRLHRSEGFNSSILPSQTPIHLYQPSYFC